MHHGSHSDFPSSPLESAQITSRCIYLSCSRTGLSRANTAVSAWKRWSQGCVLSVFAPSCANPDKAARKIGEAASRRPTRFWNALVWKRRRWQTVVLLPVAFASTLLLLMHGADRLLREGLAWLQRVNNIWIHYIPSYEYVFLVLFISCPQRLCTWQSAK